MEFSQYIYQEFRNTNSSYITTVVMSLVRSVSLLYMLSIQCILNPFGLEIVTLCAYVQQGYVFGYVGLCTVFDRLNVGLK